MALSRHKWKLTPSPVFFFSNFFCDSSFFNERGLGLFFHILLSEGSVGCPPEFFYADAVRFPVTLGDCLYSIHFSLISTMIESLTS